MNMELCLLSLQSQQHRINATRVLFSYVLFNVPYECLSPDKYVNHKKMRRCRLKTEYLNLARHPWRINSSVHTWDFRQMSYQLPITHNPRTERQYSLISYFMKKFLMKLFNILILSFFIFLDERHVQRFWIGYQPALSYQTSKTHTHIYICRHPYRATCTIDR